MTPCRRLLARAGLLLVLTCLSPGATAKWVIADQVRSYLDGLDAGAAPVVAGRLLEQPAVLSRVYRDRGHEPLWLAGAPLEEQVPALLAAIGESVGHGFAAERYHVGAIERLLRAERAEARLALELLLTDAFLAQALHRSQGSVSPPDLDPGWEVPRPEIDAGALLAAMAGHRGSVAAALAALWPRSEDYALLLERRSEILAMGDEITDAAARGLSPGQGEQPERDVPAAPHASRESRIDRIDANLERWRWLPRKTLSNYIRVNIAAFTLRAFENGEPALSMNVIVGLPYRRTPIFTESISYMEVNPYWYVPFSIATKDRLPLLKADAAGEAQKGFEARLPESDTFVPVDTIDWAPVTTDSFDYDLRQRPGPENALGNIKFMLPNLHAVYLHDTPGHELFKRQERSFSSGCIRLEEPVALADWLLRREGHPQAGSVEALIARGETTTIRLTDPVPIYIVYFTVFATDDGEIAFGRDIYGRDGELIRALRAQGS